MSTKFLQSGCKLDYSNTGSAIASGDVVVIVPGPSGMIGVAEDAIAATTGVGALSTMGVHRLAALSTDTWSPGDDVFWDAANTRLTTTRSGNTRAGPAWNTKANGDTFGDVYISPSGDRSGLVGSIVAAGTALTASSTETALGAVTVAANSLKVGDVLKVRYQGIATATNSTDTLLIKLYLGGLSGTALLTGTATDVANNNIFAGEAIITIRTIGASGTFVAVGTHTEVPAASGTAVHDITEITASTAIDTTAAVAITVSGTWSSTNAGNSCRLDVLVVERLH